MDLDHDSSATRIPPSTALLSFDMSLPSSPQKQGNGEPSTLQKPNAHTGMKKLRKKKRANNLNRALDEHDDVDDSDLVAGPAKRQRIGMGMTDDGDGDGDGESSEDEEEDVVGDGDGDEEEVEEKVVKGQDKEGESDRLEKRNTKRRKQA